MPNAKSRSEPQEKPATPHRPKPKNKVLVDFFRRHDAADKATDIMRIPSAAELPGEADVISRDRAEAEKAKELAERVAILDKCQLPSKDALFAQVLNKLSSSGLMEDGTNGEAVLNTMTAGAGKEKLSLSSESLALTETVKRLEIKLNEKDAQLADQKAQLDIWKKKVEEWKGTADAHSNRVDQLQLDLHKERKAWAGFSTDDIHSYILAISGNEEGHSISPSSRYVSSQFLVEEAFHYEDVLYPVVFNEHAMYRLVLEIMTCMRLGSSISKLPRRFQGDLWKVWMALERLEDDKLRVRVAEPMFIMVQKVCLAYQHRGIDAISVWIASQIEYYSYRHGLKPASPTEVSGGLSSAVRDWAQQILRQQSGQVKQALKGFLRVLQTRYPKDVSEWGCFLKGEQRRLIILESQGFELEDQIMLVTMSDDSRWTVWIGQRRACALLQISFDLFLIADKHGDVTSALMLKFETGWLPKLHQLRQLIPRERMLVDEDMESLRLSAKWRHYGR